MKLKSLLFPDDVRGLLSRRRQRQQSQWISGSGKWPLVVGLGAPSEEQATFDSGAVRDWVAAWSMWQGHGNIVWRERNWRALGSQSIPYQLILRDAEEVAGWVGEKNEWQTVSARYRHLVERWPALSHVLPKQLKVLATYTAEDFSKLELALAWLQSNPDSQVFARQVPVQGLDSKWLEERVSLVATLIKGVRSKNSEESDAYKVCGLKRPPQLIRMRVLDQELRKHVAGLSDISAPLEDLARLDVPACRIFVVENLQTGLAFTELANSIVIMRLGYSVTALAKIPWIRRSTCIYWGDIDTHGFAILSQFREHFPNSVSLMMDEETLMSHSNLWGDETVQHGATELNGLTQSEHAIFEGLKGNRWGTNIRLEQERIDWSVAWSKVQATSSTPTPSP